MSLSVFRVWFAGMLLFALGVVCGHWFHRSALPEQEPSGAQEPESQAAKFQQEAEIPDQGANPREGGFVLPIGPDDLLDIDTDRLIELSRNPFGSSDPFVFAFVNYADRETVERVTSAYVDGGRSGGRSDHYTLYLLAEAWARLDPSAGLSVAGSFPDREMQSNWSQAMFYTWMMRDAAAAMEALEHFEANENVHGDFRDQLMSQVMMTSVGLQAGFEDRIDPSLLSDFHLREYATLLASQDMARARAFAERLPEAKQGIVEGALLVPLALKDPLSALQAVAEMPEAQRLDAMKRVYGTWASQDPAAATLHAFEQGAPSEARYRAMSNWIYKDLDGAMGYLGHSVSETERAVILEEVFDRAGSGKRIKQMEPLLDLIPAGAARDRAVGIFLRHSFEQDPGGALRRLDLEIEAGAGYEVAKTLLHSQGMTDEVALEVLNKLAPGDRDRVAQAVVQMYTMNGISDELKFRMVTDMVDSNNRRWVIRTFFERMTRRDPGKAVELLARLSPEETEAGQSYDAVASAWAAEDPDAALAWALESDIPDELRGDTLGRVLERIARNSPDLAMAEVQSFPDVGMRRTALEKIARQVADRNPEEFANYVQQLPPSEVAPEVYRSIAAVWLEKDPLNGSKWVDALPAGAEREHAIVGLVDALRGSDPESAFHWAADMQGGRRVQMLRNTLYSLAEKDAAVARRVFDQAELSEEDRKAIQHVLPKEE